MIQLEETQGRSVSWVLWSWYGSDRCVHSLLWLLFTLWGSLLACYKNRQWIDTLAYGNDTGSSEDTASYGRGNIICYFHCFLLASWSIVCTSVPFVTHCSVGSLLPSLSVCVYFQETTNKTNGTVHVLLRVLSL